MKSLRGICATTLLGALLSGSPNLVRAQAEQEAEPLIMVKPQGASFGRERLQRLHATLKKRSAKATSKLLPLTKTEVWMVPPGDVEGIRQTAARHGVIMSRLGATWSHVFRKAAANVRVNDRQRSIVDRAKAAAATAAVRLMSVAPPSLMEHALTRGAPRDAVSVTIQLSDTVQLPITRTGFEIRAGMCIWSGKVDGTDAPVTILWWPDGRMAGTVQHEGRLYSLRHLGGDLHAVVEKLEERMPPEHAPISSARRARLPQLPEDPLVAQGDASRLRAITVGIKPLALTDFGTKERRDIPALVRRLTKAKPKAVRPTDDVIIDVLVAYTRAAASHYADVRRELVELAIEEANLSFRLSNLGRVKLRLVHTYQTTYVESGEHFDHLWRFADKGDGFMEEVHGLRDLHRADVAVLVVDDASGCGLATRVFAEEHEAFAVAHHGCAAASYSVAHEIGHLIGARHDPSMDKSTMPFPYGHGYVNGTKWRDIMSYKQTCGGCPRVPVWSSPTVTIRGERAGTPSNDNARVILDQAARVAAFR